MQLCQQIVELFDISYPDIVPELLATSEKFKIPIQNTTKDAILITKNS